MPNQTTRLLVADSTAREIAERHFRLQMKQRVAPTDEQIDLARLIVGSNSGAELIEVIAAALADAVARVRQAEQDRDTSIRASAQNGERWAALSARLAAVERNGDDK